MWSPIVVVLTCKKLMLYHNLVDSDGRRKAKQIVKEQERCEFKEWWFGNVYVCRRKKDWTARYWKKQ